MHKIGSLSRWPGAASPILTVLHLLYALSAVWLRGGHALVAWMAKSLGLSIRSGASLRTRDDRGRTFGWHRPLWRRPVGQREAPQIPSYKRPSTRSQIKIPEEHRVLGDCGDAAVSIAVDGAKLAALLGVEAARADIAAVRLDT